MKKIVYMLLLVINCSVYSQSLSLFDIDTTNFPTIKAKIFALDANGNQIKNLLKSNFELKENSQLRIVTNLTCPAAKPPAALSSVLTIDASGSMFGINLNIAKEAAKSWVNATSLGKSECAVTSFDNINYINQDFTIDRNLLLNAINNLNANGGTDYNYGLLYPLAGSLVISKTGMKKKVVVFITDGCPNEEPNVTQIINEAISQNCSIYSVVVGNVCPKSLMEISNKTGGKWFDNITSVVEAKKIYQQILLTAQGGEPCSIEWQSVANCQAGLTDVDLKLLPLNLTEFRSYESPYSSISKLEFSPLSLSFKNALPGKKIDSIVKITARNDDFNITNITSSNSAFTLDKTSFVIPKDQSINLTVSFTPFDSGYVFVKFSLENNICPTNFYATGGFSGKKPKVNTLKITNPNGSEEFIAGSDTLITWEGIAESDAVQLAYTIDNGINWKTLSKNVSGLKYLWKNIPKPESKQCKVRVKQNSVADTNNQLGIVQFTLNGHADGINKIKWSPDGSRVATASSDGTAIIWDASNGTKIHTLNGHTANINNLSWSPDGSRIATASWDSTSIIWNASSGTKIRTLSGHNDIVWDVSWSPDGSRIATASFDNTAIIWNASTGVKIHKLTGHTAWVSVVRWNSDGTRIATSGNDNLAIIWDTKSGNEFQQLSGHTDWVSDVNWSPDGTQIATAGFDNNAIIWNVETGSEIQTLTGHTARVNNIKWSPDGFYAATSSDDNTAIIWDPKTGTIFQKLKGLTYLVNNVSWNSDGSRIIASSDNSALIWEVSSGTQLYKLSGHTDNVTDVSWSPDGVHIATSSLDNTAKIWYVIESNVELQEDESDKLFSIVEPKAKALDVDMGMCLVGTSKDSLVTGFVSNTGSCKFRVDSIYFSGTDAASFKLVSGIPKYELSAGSSKIAEFRFSPKHIGIHTANINIITQSDTLNQIIQGEGTQNQIAIVSPIIDFGKVKVGSEKTIQDTVLIKNISEYPITIDSVVQLGPDYIQFEVVKGGGTFTIEPLKSQKLTLKFKPHTAGRTTGGLGFVFHGIGSPAKVQLFGEGIRITPQITTNSPICESDDLLLFSRTIQNAQYNWFGPDGFKSNLQNPIIKKAIPAQSGKYYMFASFGNIYSDTVSFDIIINTNLIKPSDSSLIFVGSAAEVDDYIKLTDPKIWDGGSIWLKNRFSVKLDFTTTFQIRVRYGDNNGNDDGFIPGADGIAFVMQNHNYPFLGVKGGSMGYTGITNSLAIEFDLYKNPWDPNGNHIAVQSMGSLPNQPDHTKIGSCLGIEDKIITVQQDSLYFVKIEYSWTSKTLKIFIDSTGKLDSPALTIPNIDLTTYLKLEEGEYVYIGFTSGTGEAYQEHDLFDWTIPCKNQLVSDVENNLTVVNNSDFSIFPNPAGEYLEINFNAINPMLKHGVDASSEIQIFDMLGINVSPAGGGIKGGGMIDISNLSPGIYFIKIGNRVEKFVKI